MYHVKSTRSESLIVLSLSPRPDNSLARSIITLPSPPRQTCRFMESFVLSPKLTQSIKTLDQYTHSRQAPEFYTTKIIHHDPGAAGVEVNERTELARVPAW